jgi:hypothetical protein
MFGNKAKPSRIWACKARQPHEGRDLVEEQLRVAHKYKNALIAVERDRREERDRVLAKALPTLAKLEEAREAAFAAVQASDDAFKAGNVAAGRRRNRTGAERKFHAALKSAAEEAKKAAASYRARGLKKPKVQAKLKAVDVAAHARELEARRVARQEWGLFWGTYLSIEASVGQIKKGPVPKFRRRKKGESFVGYTGAVSVQVQGGLTWEQLCAGEDSRVRLLPAASTGPQVVQRRVMTDAERRQLKGLQAESVKLRHDLVQVDRAAKPDLARRTKIERRRAEVRDKIRALRAGCATVPVTLPQANPESAKSKKRSRYELWIRVGSKGLAPVWAKAIVFVSRVPPADALVTWARLRRDLRGRTAVWEAQFIWARDSWCRTDGGGTGEVGVNLNWRRMGNSLRVATAVGSDGQVRHLFMPSKLFDAKKHDFSLSSARDLNFDSAHAALREFAKDTAVTKSEWFTENTKALAQWKSKGRLAELAWNWGRNRFEGDDLAYQALEAWRRQDRHLHDWLGAAEEKITHARNDLYRQFARELADTYRTVRLADIDYAKLRRTAEVGKTDKPQVRLNAGLAAPGTLNRYLKEAFAEVVLEKPENITQACHSCGTVNAVDVARTIRFVCVGCGVEHDIDVNAASNLLAGCPAAAVALPLPA